MKWLISFLFDMFHTNTYMCRSWKMNVTRNSYNNITRALLNEKRRCCIILIFICWNANGISLNSLIVPPLKCDKYGFKLLLIWKKDSQLKCSNKMEKYLQRTKRKRQRRLAPLSAYKKCSQVHNATSSASSTPTRNFNLEDQHIQARQGTAKEFDNTPNGVLQDQIPTIRKTMMDC